MISRLFWFGLGLVVGGVALWVWEHRETIGLAYKNRGKIGAAAEVASGLEGLFG